MVAFMRQPGLTWPPSTTGTSRAELIANGATIVMYEGAPDWPERDRLWAQHVAVLPRFGDYPDQVGGRIIPVVRLTPAG